MKLKQLDMMKEMQNQTEHDTEEIKHLTAYIKTAMHEKD